MMIRSAPSDQPTTRDLAIMAVSLIVVGVAVFAVATRAQDSPPVFDFMGRAQARSDAQRVEGLLGAIGRSNAAGQQDASSSDAAAHLTVITKTSARKKIALE